jgi:purine-nucleoside phosphorylase
VGIVLGSGLGDFVDRVAGPTLPYASIDGFPETTVSGHRGLLKAGEEAIIMAGRFHMYEGREADDVVLPVCLLQRLGVDTLIVTNAAGAVNPAYAPGDLVLIRDHLNLMGRNPLVGPTAEGLGPRFPDMSSAYSPRLRALARDAWPEPLAEGVYAGLLGPSYETPAEIRMLRGLGADMVGMSTVPEVIVAASLGLEVLGISCITNMAAGMLDQPLSHEEVVETGGRVAGDFARLLVDVLRRIRRE